MCESSPSQPNGPRFASSAPPEGTPTESQLEALFRLCPDMLCIAGADGYFKRVNPAFEKTLGYPSESLLSLPIIEFVHPDDREQTQAELQRLIQGIPASHFENRYRCRDGSFRWLSWLAVPLAGSASIYAVASDVTQQKQAEERFRRVIEATPDAVVAINSAGQIVLVNAQTEKLFGYRREELLGQTVELLIPERLRSTHRTYRQAYYARPQEGPMGRRAELTCIRKDGSEFCSDVSLSPIPTADGLWMYAAVRDTTERRLAQQTIEANLRTRNAISQILHISLEVTSLQEQLQRTLELLLSLPWIALQAKGAIFLVEENSGTLVMRAQIGMSEPLLSQCSRVPFGKCLCGIAASTRQPVFADRIDERHETRYPEMAPHGHYCVPIVSEGQVQGVLTLYVSAGHQQDPEEEAFLFAVADVLAGIIRREQSEQRVRASEAQLLAAQKIQEHLLPSQAPHVAGYDIAGGSYPAEYTAGDTFDYLTLRDGSLALAIGDVAGHGFAPALLMASTHAYLRLLAQTSDDVGEILTRTNQILAAETEDDRFVTFLLGRLEANTRSFTYCNAGHPTGYLLDASGMVKSRLESTNLPLGISRDTVFSASGSLLLAPGDLLLLVTDGIRESQSPTEEPFGDDRILEIVRAHRHQPSQAIVERLYGAVLDFCGGAKPIDDVTTVILKVIAWQDG